MNQLEGLKQFTTIVADSGDIESIRFYAPQDATTNPSLILKSSGLITYQPLLEDALEYARQQGGNKEIQIINASDKLAVNIGIEILKIIPGRVSTEVDARISFDRGMCVAKSRKLISLYQDQGIHKSRILIKLASTWEGIKAAEELEKEGIHCNLTLLFSFAQARACAEAGVSVISPFVGRIYDWYHHHKPIEPYIADEDPGIQSVRKIYDYYKKHRYQTIIMGASFRRVEQILALSGCDCLTISPQLLNELYNRNQRVECQLFLPTKAFHPPTPPLSQSEFSWEHNQNAMAVEKLSEGIRLFSVDQKHLEALLSEKL